MQFLRWLRLNFTIEFYSNFYFILYNKSLLLKWVYCWARPVLVLFFAWERRIYKWLWKHHLKLSLPCRFQRFHSKINLNDNHSNQTHLVPWSTFYVQFWSMKLHKLTSSTWETVTNSFPNTTIILLILIKYGKKW